MMSRPVEDAASAPERTTQRRHHPLAARVFSPEVQARVDALVKAAAALSAVLAEREKRDDATRNGAAVVDDDGEGGASQPPSSADDDDGEGGAPPPPSLDERVAAATDELARARSVAGSPGELVTAAWAFACAHAQASLSSCAFVSWSAQCLTS